MEVRLKSNALASCPLELERLLKERIFFPLKPQIIEIRIHLNLPSKLVELMMQYEMCYDVMKPGVSKEDGKVIKVGYP